MTATAIFVAYVILFKVTAIVSFLASPLLSERNANLNLNLTSTVYLLNVLTYQNYAYGYMMIVYRIKLLLSDVGDYADKLGKSSEKNLHRESDELKNISIIVDKICDCLEGLKVGYTINTVAYLLQFSFSTIMTVYSVLAFLFKRNSGPRDLEHCILIISWEIYYVYFVAFVFVVANLISKEGKRICLTIQELRYKCQQNAKFHKRAALMLLQMHHRPPLVSCGVFVIDWKLLFQLMGACFSYLVIIIQFEFKSF